MLTAISRGKADTTGIVVRDDDAKYIIVAYRGSRSIKNWISNFAMALFEVPAFCKECRIHKGFYEAYLEVKDEIWNAVQDQEKQYPGYKLVTVGHSLGGAVAQITATDFRVRGKQVTAVRL